MPEFFTFKKDADAAAKLGQRVKFTAGKGYYITGTPAPAPAAPKQVSDAASGGGYTGITAKTAATPASQQPTAAVAPPQTSDAASGGGYSTGTKQPTAPPLSPGTTTSTPVDRPTAPSSTPGPAPAQQSDAASSGGYGSRYYTYRVNAANAARPGQKVGFTTGKGYYLYYPATPSPPRPPTSTPPITPVTPTQPGGGGGGGGGSDPGGGGGTEPGTSTSHRRRLQGISRTAGRIPHPLEAAHRKHPPKEWQTSVGREQYALRYAEIGLNLTPFQAAALVGNMSYESTNISKPGSPRLDPSTGEVHGAGYGIAQWTIDAAKKALQDYATSFRLSQGNFGLQLAFVGYELVSDGASQYGRLIVPGTLAALQNAKTIEEATAIVEAGFEQPGGHDGLDFRRLPSFPSSNELLKVSGHTRLDPQEQGADAATYYDRLDRARQILQGS